MGDYLLLAADSATASYWLVWLLCALAGLLIGGTWSAYQNSTKLVTAIMAILSVLCTAAALMKLFGG